MREERVAGRLLAQQHRHGPGPVVELMACARFGEGDHLQVVESPDLELLDALLPSQRRDGLDEGMAGLEIGVAVRAHDHQRGRRHVGEHVAQHRHGRLAGPVEIVEHDQDRGVGRDERDRAGDRLQQQVALGLGVGGVRGRQVRVAAPEVRHERRQLRTVQPDRLLDQLRRRGVEQVGDGLDPRLVGDGELLVGSAVQHDRAPTVHLGRQLGAEAGLADPRFAREEREPSFAPFGCLERLGERAHLGGTTGERLDHVRFEPVGQRDRALDLHRLPQERHRGHRLGDAAELELPDALEGVIGLARHHRDELGRDDLSGFALRGQARGFDHGLAEVVAVLLGRVAGREPDAHPERLLAAGVVAFDGLLHRDAAVERGGQAREHDHEPVAEVLHLGAALRLHRGTQQPEVDLAEVLGRLRSEPR